MDTPDNKPRRSTVALAVVVLVIVLSVAGLLFGAAASLGLESESDAPNTTEIGVMKTGTTFVETPVSTEDVPNTAATGTMYIATSVETVPDP